MKKLDEMDRTIQLRAQEIAYRVTLVIMSVWTLYNCWQTLANGAPFQPLPGLIVCLSVCVQSFSQMAMKRKMTAGDEEYHEPNKLLWVVLAALAIAAIVLSVGTFFLLRP